MRLVVMALAALSIPLSAESDLCAAESPDAIFRTRQLVLFEVQSLSNNGKVDDIPGAWLRSYTGTVVVKESLPPGLEQKTFTFAFQHWEQNPETFLALQRSVDCLGGTYWIEPAVGARCVVVLDAKDRFEPANMRCLASSPSGRDTGFEVRPERGSAEKHFLKATWDDAKTFYHAVTGAKGGEAGRLAQVLVDRRPVGETFFDLIRENAAEVYGTQEFNLAVASWLKDSKIRLDFRIQVAYRRLAPANDEKSTAELFRAHVALLREATRGAQRDGSISVVLDAIQANFLPDVTRPPKRPPLDDATRDLLLKLTTPYDTHGSVKVRKWALGEDETKP